MRLIAFAGKKGAGKDAAAAVFVGRGYANIKLADGLKAMLRALLVYRGASEELVTRMLEGDLKETSSPLLAGRTPRYAMQSLGDGWGRDMMDPNLWVDATADQIDQHERVVVSDVRRPNEADMVRGRGGEIHMVLRPRADSEDEHASETDVLLIEPDRTLYNLAPSLEGFQASVRRRYFTD